MLSRKIRPLDSTFYGACQANKTWNNIKVVEKWSDDMKKTKLQVDKITPCSFIHLQG
jgi:hypothetical protein